MVVASQKRKENIAEYLLYMWQIEDIIRFHKLDLDAIRTNIVERFTTEPDTRRRMLEWYESLIDMMRREEVCDKGHLQMNQNIIGELADLNRRVLEDSRFDKYRMEYYRTLPFIVELRSKSADNPSGEIETCFNALYGILLLRLQGKTISTETTTAIEQISRFIALLAKYFHLDEQEKLWGDDGPGGPKNSQ